jgi:serine/threonine protein phosphatase PrpC
MPTLPDRVVLPGIAIGYLTDPGVVRAENQDALFVPDPDAAMDTKGRGVLVAVADGMGGHAGGALASRTAVESMAAYYSEPGTGLPLDLIALQKVERAHERILALTRERPQLKGMGTTITAVLITGADAAVFNVGDSRTYLFRGGALKQLTTDHTLAARWAAQGTQRNTRIGANKLTRALGAASAEVDRVDATLARGDRLLLCSDGLHGVAPEAKIIEVLGTAQTAWEAAKKLVAAAKESGGPDNVTAVVVQVG